ncbi:DedA family protein [Glycomyces salinus]|uniref:DedA family protein n=1 Tax=Glycomyces salinus TaxID=980294 RepID=UPI0018EDD28A|nr:VTT domain-containing protein [Glycomyces salinus]
MDWPSELVIDLGFGGVAVESVMPAWGFLVFVSLAMAVPMGPAEATAATAGALAGPASAPQWLASLVVAAGMFTGDLLAYGAGGPIARRLRRRSKAANRLDCWRRRLESRPARRDIAVIGLRFVPGARTPSALMARGSGIGLARFCVLTAAGSVLWAGVWTTLGSAIAEFSGPIASTAAVILAPVALLIVWRCLAFRTRVSA